MFSHSYIEIVLAIFVVVPVYSDAIQERAIEKASEFILSKRDPYSFEWHPLETAAAVLGLYAGNPIWTLKASNQGADDDDEAATKASSTAALKLAVLNILHSNNGSLSNLDDSSFVQLSGAWQVSCLDLNNAYGINLVEEARSRFSSARARSPALPGLVLPLCNNRALLEEPGLLKLALPRRRGRVICNSLCVEKTALNVIALSCLIREKGYLKKGLAFIKNELEFSITHLKQILPRQFNLAQLSLLLQASSVSPISLGVDTDLLTKRLLKLQSADGSFGGSVSLTALAIPALSNFNSLDIPSVTCPKANEPVGEENGHIRVYYRIEDLFFHSQTLIGDFQTMEGTSLFRAIEEYEKSYPFIISFELKSTVFGRGIKSLVGIDESRVTVWNVYRIGLNETETRIYDIDATIIKGNDIFAFKYERK